MKTPEQVPEEVPDLAQRYPSIDELILTVQQTPDAWAGRVILNEPTPKGTPGPSLGSMEREPVETLPDRLVATFGAPLQVLVRLRKQPAPGEKAAGWSNYYLHEVSSRAATVPVVHEPASQPVAAVDTEKEELRAQVRALQEKLSTPSNVAAVPSSPFEASIKVIEVARELARFSAPPTPPAPPIDLDKAIAIGKELAGKANSTLEIVQAVAPYVAGLAEKILGTMDKVAEATITERRAQSAAWAAQTAARGTAPPFIEAPTAPATAPFAGHGGTTGSDSEAVEVKEHSDTENGNQAVESARKVH